MRDVEDARVGAHRPVLGDHALVLHGHLPARERARAARRGRRDARRAAFGAVSASPADAKEPIKEPPRLRLGSRGRGGRTGSSRVNRDGRPRGHEIIAAPARSKHRSRKSIVSQERRHFEDVVRDLEASAGPRAARRPFSAGSSVRRRRRSRAGPKPVAITVTRTSSPWVSSITAPKMTFAFWSAAEVTTCAASFTSKSPMSGPPVTFSRFRSRPRSTTRAAATRPRRAPPRSRGSRPRPRRCPSAPSRPRS